MKLYDIDNAVQDLPWLAIGFLLDAYRDRRAQFNASRSVDNDQQWTINKGAQNIKLILEADQNAINRYTERVRQSTEANLYLYPQRVGLRASLDNAVAAENPEAIADLTAQLASCEEQIATQEAALAALVAPSADRTVYTFPLSLDDLKGFDGVGAMSIEELASAESAKAPAIDTPSRSPKPIEPPSVEESEGK